MGLVGGSSSRERRPGLMMKTRKGGGWGTPRSVFGTGAKLGVDEDAWTRQR
ncbi:hypothetical protein TIFTF001_015062 [Ficus carica]|uniref:Uncharacterized protein n=1 Tax=Ficus carica TaxID=3494 RepID=A0AA88AH46_FICCA|nr:hypothetical protein TIFTF001_015062 [Ficus carica]